MKPKLTKLSSALCISLAVISTTGCVATTGSMARYDDRADPCYSNRQPLIQTEQQLGRKMVAGALIGGLGAAGVSALAGGDSTTTIISAITGAIAGASIGYYQGMEQKRLTQQQMVSEIYGDAQRDAQRVSRTRGLIGSLNACRNRQIDQLEAEFRAGRITSAEVVRRANAIQVASQTDNELISTVLGHANERSQTYIDATSRATGLGNAAVLGDVGTYNPVRSMPTVMASGPSKPYVSTKSSNVRSAPSTAASVVGGLQSGQAVPVLGVSGDWLQIAFDGQPAYVHHSLLAPEGSAAARNARQSATRTSVASVPQPKTPVQEVALESRRAAAEAAENEQKISSRLNDLLLLGGQKTI